MKWVAAVVAMCAGCNALLGVHDFAQTDAAIDATPDAPAHVLCSPMSMLAGGFDTTFGVLWNLTGGMLMMQPGGVISVKISAPTTFNSISYYDIREGSFMIALGTDMSSVTPQVDLELVSQIAGNRAGFVRNGATLELHRTKSGVDAMLGSVAYDATTHKYLRFSVTAGQLTYEASPDGTTFSVLGTSDADALTFVQVVVNFAAQGIDYNATLENANGTAATGAACPIVELADDFSTGLDKWARMFVSGGSLAIVNGAAHLSFAADNSTDTMGLVASTVYDMHQSALTLEIPQMVDVATTQAFIVLAQSRLSQTAVEFAQTGGMLTSSVIRNGTQTKISTNAYDPLQMRWWRLHATLTSVSWEVSPDRNAWTQLAEAMAIDGLDNMEIEIAAQGMSMVPNEAIVDNVGGL